MIITNALNSFCRFENNNNIILSNLVPCNTTLRIIRCFTDLFRQRPFENPSRYKQQTTYNLQNTILYHSQCFLEAQPPPPRGPHPFFVRGPPQRRSPQIRETYSASRSPVALPPNSIAASPTSTSERSATLITERRPSPRLSPRY